MASVRLISEQEAEGKVREGSKNVQSGSANPHGCWALGRASHTSDA
jgi:hypothetical protein